MARPIGNQTNGSQDRTQDRTAAAQPRSQRPAQPVEHGLPWSQAEGQQGYDQHGHPQPGQLPWPAQDQYPQAALPPQASNGYAPHQQYASAADAHHGHYFQSPPNPAFTADPYRQPVNGVPAYPAQQGYGDPAEHLRGSYAPYGDPGYAPAPGQPNGYPQPAYGSPEQPLDSRSYDLGAYATQPAGFADPNGGRGQPMQQPAYGNAYPQPYPAQAQIGHGYPGQPPSGPAYPGQLEPVFDNASAHDAAGEAEYDDEDYEDDEEEDEPGRRFGALKMIASLVVAIAIGGGMAYGYKKFGGSSFASAKPIVLKADASPIKIRAGSDGMQIASVDQKAGERLGEPVPAVVPATTIDNSASSGTRRVQTIAIAPDGSASPPAQASMRPTISIPGVSIDGMQGPAPQAALPPQLPQPLQQQALLPPVTPAPIGRAVAPPPGASQKAPIAPKVIASTETAAPSPTTPKPAAQKVAVAKAKTTDAYSPNGGATATVATATTLPSAVGAPKIVSNGFVAVLASQSTAIDARKTLDDLQGKYTEVIGSKPTDVTEATVNGKVYYRAIVGPPGSREAAIQICSQLKTAGHRDCFATASPY